MKVLKFTAIWNIIVGILPIIGGIVALPNILEITDRTSGFEYVIETMIIMFGIAVVIMRLPALISGILYINYLSLPDEKLATKKVPIMVWSIINILTANVVGAITGFMSAKYISELKNEISKNKAAEIKSIVRTKKEQEEIKRKNSFNVLLNVGIFLIVFSGLIISTSTWDVISDNVKIILVFITSLVFGMLSYVFKSKIVNKKAEMVYYILSGVFLVLTVIAIGTYGVLGTYMSFEGDGSYILSSIIFGLSGLIAYSIRITYKKENFIYLQYGLNNIAVISLFSGFIDSNIGAICAALQIIVLAAVYINMFNKLKLNSRYQVLLPIIIIVNTIYIATYLSQVLQSNSTILWSVIVLIGNLILMHTAVVNKDKTILNLLSTILYNIVIFINLIILQSDNLIATLIFSVIYLIDNILILSHKESIKYFVAERYLQLIKIAAVLISIFMILEYYYIDLGSMWLLLPINIALLIFYFTKQNFKEKNICLLISLVLSYYYLMISYYYVTISIIELNIFTYIINIITFVITLIVTCKDKKGNLINRYIANIGLAISVFILCGTDTISKIVVENLKDISFTVGFMVQQYTTLIIHIIGIAIYMLMAIGSRKHKNLSGINLLFAAFLGISFINELHFINEFKTIFVNIILTLIIFNITRLILDIKRLKTIHIIERIALICIQLPIIFSDNILAVSYIAIIDIIFVFVGINSKKLYSLFHVGIISIILTAIFQFREFLGKIPFPVYIFFIGVGIVVYITFREMNRKENRNIKTAKSNINEKEKVLIDNLSNEKNDIQNKE